jgi:DUF2924 family protein
MSEAVTAAVEAELERLRSMPIVELRALWRANLKSEPPKAFGPDLLRRSISYKIQEDAYGGLTLTIRQWNRSRDRKTVGANSRLIKVANPIACCDFSVPLEPD